MSTEQFEAWGLVELFGRQQVAGRLTEQTVGGCHFLRVDIPDNSESGYFTRLFTQGAIYGVTLTDEATARRAAASWGGKPLVALSLDISAPRGSLEALDDYTDD